MNGLLFQICYLERYSNGTNCLVQMFPPCFSPCGGGYTFYCLRIKRPHLHAHTHIHTFENGPGVLIMFYKHYMVDFLNFYFLLKNSFPRKYKCKFTNLQENSFSLIYLLMAMSISTAHPTSLLERTCWLKLCTFYFSKENVNIPHFLQWDFSKGEEKICWRLKIALIINN